MVIAMLYLPEPGELLTFEYPVRNRVDRPTEYRLRRIVVKEILDLREQPPVDSAWIVERPYTARGRHLVTGFDLDAKAERSFYLEAMRHAKRDTWITLGLYDPVTDDPRPLAAKGVYAPTEQDRAYMAAVLRHFRHRSQTSTHCLCATAFELTEEMLWDGTYRRDNE